MKKIFSIAVAAVLALAVFTGCEISSNETETLVKLDNYGIVAGDTKIAFSDCEIKDAYCGTYDGKKDVVAGGGEVIISIDEAGVLTLAGYSWDSETITLKSAIDLSGYTKMTINAKRASDYTPGDAIIFELGDSDNGSTGYNSWTDANFLKFTTGFSEFSVDLEKLTNQGGNSKIGSTDINLKKVDKIVINPRGASGNFYIASIVFE